MDYEHVAPSHVEGTEGVECFRFRWLGFRSQTERSPLLRAAICTITQQGTTVLRS